LTKTDIVTNTELQRISWACLQYWNGEPLAPEDRLICYKWVKRVYQAQFGETFSPQKLGTLARLGVLTADDTSRGGNRRYYKLTNPAALANLLARVSMN
jgi:hypothetical protein